MTLLFITYTVYLHLRKANCSKLLIYPCLYVYNNATVKRFAHAVIIVMSLKSSYKKHTCKRKYLRLGIKQCEPHGVLQSLYCIRTLWNRDLLNQLKPIKPFKSMNLYILDLAFMSDDVKQSSGL